MYEDPKELREDEERVERVARREAVRNRQARMGSSPIIGILTCPNCDNRYQLVKVPLSGDFVAGDLCIACNLGRLVREWVPQ